MIKVKGAIIISKILTNTNSNLVIIELKKHSSILNINDRL